MEITEKKLPKIFLLVSSLEAEELVFTASPPDDEQDWALCSVKIAKQMAKGTLNEGIYIIRLKEILVFPVIAIFESEFEEYTQSLFGGKIGWSGAFVATASPSLHRMYDQHVTLSALLYILWNENCWKM